VEMELLPEELGVMVAQVWHQHLVAQVLITLVVAVAEVMQQLLEQVVLAEVLTATEVELVLMVLLILAAVEVAVTKAAVMAAQAVQA
jgi:hypothetical protein